MSTAATSLKSIIDAVAGVVGAMMASVMGVRDRPTMERAIDLGIAFQLTNISRDVMEDAADGRVYLPADWLEEEGAPLNPAEFPGAEPALYRVVKRLLDEADRYYESAGVGIARLPFRCAWAIAAARRVYRAIGETVQECRETLRDALADWLIAAYEGRDPIPAVTELAWLNPRWHNAGD